MPKLVADVRLIAGQSPFSTTMAAQAVVRALGHMPTARALLQANPKRCKTDLVAMLGHYQHGTATDDTARRQAISAMELATPHFAHPQLPVSLARAHAAPSFAFP